MLDAIVMDMDGTLLDPNNKILPETKEALIACQKQGTKLVLASGRSYTRLLSYAKELEMDADAKLELYLVFLILQSYPTVPYNEYDDFLNHP